MKSTRVSEKFRIRFPIIQGPFGGGISSVALACTVSNAGGLGSFGAHLLSPEDLKKTVSEIRAKTENPFSMNLWVPWKSEKTPRLSEAEREKSRVRLKPFYDELGMEAPQSFDFTFPDYDAQVAALIEAKPPAMSFIFGLPSHEVLKDCARRGILTLGTATNVDEALALEEIGIDVVVASGAEAGGHRSSFLRDPLESPALSALIPQVKDRLRIPFVAAGGIADGRGVVSAMVLGAEGVQVGTAFVACEESNASPAYRAALRTEEARYTKLTKVFSGRYARGVPNRFVKTMEEFENDLPLYPLQNALTQPIRRAAGKAGKSDLLSIWAGQNAALIRHSKAADVMKFLVEDTARVLATLR